MGVSITELLDVIKKSGLPLGENLQKKETQLTAEDLLRQKLTGIYEPQFSALDTEKKKKIENLANVDRQMSQIFGAGGKYQLRNPADAEGLTNTRFNTSLSDFNTTVDKQNNLLGVFEQDVAKANTLYSAVKPTASEGIDDSNLLKKYGINLEDWNPNKVADSPDWEIVPMDWEIVPEENKLKGSDKINMPLG
jgi:hypothetical protein